MTRHKELSLLLFFLLSCVIMAQEPTKLLRYPALSPDGSVLAFSYQGDIWKVSSSGGTAMRLTVHAANDITPKFSPDGKNIVFSGSRYGNNDLFVIPTEGGSAKRLTWHSANDMVYQWTGSGDILFNTVREFVHVERDAEIYSIPAKGGTEGRILDVLGFDPVQSPDDRFIAFTIGGSNPVVREAYRGSANRNIWIYDKKNNSYHKLINSTANEHSPEWLDNRTLAYISSESGKYNIYKVSVDESGKAKGSPEQITSFKDFAVRAFTAANNGKVMVIEQGDGLYVMKDGKSPQRLNIYAPADDRFDPEENKTLTKDADEYAVSPNGKLMAIVERGEIFVKEADKEKSRSVNVSNHPYRDMNADWLNDSTIIFASDRAGGNFDLYIARSADKNQPNMFKSLKHEVVRLTKTDEDEQSPVVSPDGKKVSFMRGRGTFVVADINKDGTLGKETILSSGWASADNVAWSPDSKWLAYTMADLYFNDEIYIQPADNSAKPVNVSMHPRGDFSPFWSPDGSKLGFISGRNGRNNDVWFVWLKKEDWQKTKQDWEDKEPAKKDDKNSKKDSAKVTPVVIDFENIHERLTQVTSFPGNEGSVLISKDGETFYYVGSNSSAKGNDLYSIKWDGKDLKELTKGGQNPGGLSFSKDGAYIYYMKQGGSISRHDVKSDKQESLPYVLKMNVNYDSEKDQVFEEAWRTIYNGFYDPKFHGNDWGAIGKKYKPLCLAASTETDFRDMFNFMLGELNSSHMGLFRGERGETQKDATGLLGAELKPVPGGVRVERVIPESPADRNSSRLFIGDVITGVNGKSVEGNNIYELLQNTVDEQI